jgi:hypothetical protein
VYYRDKKGRRRVLRPATIIQEARRLPEGYHMAIYYWSDHEVSFGLPLPLRMHPVEPYIVDIPWYIDEKAAKEVYCMIVEEMYCLETARSCAHAEEHEA